MQSLPDCLIMLIVDAAALSAAKGNKQYLKAARGIHFVIYTFAQLNHDFRDLVGIQPRSLEHVIQRALKFREAGLISGKRQQAIHRHAHDQCWVESCKHCDERLSRFDTENGGCDFVWICDGCSKCFCDSIACFGEENLPGLCRFCDED